MIKISVVSYNNEVLLSAPSAIFDRQSRTLGRSKENYFVLDDPKNLVSRIQALVMSDGARHTIINLSRSTPIVLNGQEIDPDREYDLRSGDEIQIGLYVLRAEAVIESVSSGSAANSASHAFAPETAAAFQVKPPAGPDIADAPILGTMQQPANRAEAASPAQNADEQALMQAFLKGAGIPAAALSQGLTPEFMETVGKLLAISVRGTMDLNALRAIVKREAKAEVTQVLVRNNNPLKFLDDSETVLMQMFRKKMPGFMGPAEAMEDAYADLRLHQLGMVAGMRAAMSDIFKRISPEKLDAMVKDQSFLDSMRPTHRKARLWDAYTELFARIDAQTRDDLQALFGPAFLDAYEQETDRLKTHAQHS